MLTDLHAHTSGISKCCKISAGMNIFLARLKGFNAIVITNHYKADYFQKKKVFDKASYDNWIERYIEEWQKCKAFGKKFGVHIFCGIEVTMNYNPDIHILIYGCDEKFIRENPRLNELSLSELYALCHNKGYAVVQAHPFRGKSSVQNVNHLDGLEISCHPLYKNSYYEDILKITRENRLAVTVGCDYHADTYRAKGGVFLPESIKTDRELADYILKSNSFSLQIHDPRNKKLLRLQHNKAAQR